VTHRIRGAALPLLVIVALATSALAGAGCKKQQESLVVAQLKLDSPDPLAMDLSLTLMANAGPAKAYPAVTTLSTTATELGLYVNIVGGVMVTAVAKPASGGCVGFRGSDSTTISSAGDTVLVVITMRPDNVCPADGGGGTAGSAGSAGTGGTGGSAAGTGGSAGAAAGRGGSAGTAGGGAGTGGSTAGTAGAAGGRGGTGGSTGGMSGTTGAGGMAGYPSIANCRPFNHAATGNCAFVEVRKIAVSPNGQLVATAGDDYRVKIWSFDGQSLTAAGPVFDTNGGVHGVAFSPDGTRFVFTDGGTVRTYTVNGWAPGTTLVGDGGNDTLAGVAFTPDGQRVISVDDKGFSGGNVYVHDFSTTSGLPALTKLVTDEPWSLAVSPKTAADGSLGIAVGSYYQTIQVLKLTSSALSAPTVLMTRTPPATASSDPVGSVQFSPDGALLASGDDWGAVRFWNYPLASTTPSADTISFAGMDTVGAIAFAPNGMYVAVGGAFYNGQLSIYDVALPQTELTRLAAPTLMNNISSLAFTPSGGAILAGEDDCGTVLVCN